MQKQVPASSPNTLTSSRGISNGIIAFPLASLAFFFFLGTAWCKERPNVVIFLTDDQGTLDAGCYGSDYLRTPQIDKLAKTGV